MLGTAAASAVSAMISVNLIWYSAIQSSVFFLLLGIIGFASQGLAAVMTIRRAARSGRRLRPASGRGR